MDPWSQRAQPPPPPGPPPSGQQGAQAQMAQGGGAPPPPPGPPPGQPAYGLQQQAQQQQQQAPATSAQYPYGGGGYQAQQPMYAAASGAQSSMFGQTGAAAYQQRGAMGYGAGQAGSYNAVPPPPQGHHQPYGQRVSGMGMAPSAAGAGAGAPRRTGEERRVLWLGGITSAITNNDVMEKFSPFGEVQGVKLAPHKSCAFVVFAELDDAIKAYHAYKHSYLLIKGGNIKIGWGKADPDSLLTEKPRSSVPPTSNLYVGGLALTVTEDKIRELFAPYGQITRLSLVRNLDCAFVNFSTIAEAERAMAALHGYNLDGRPIRVNYGKSQTRSSSSGGGGYGGGGMTSLGGLANGSNAIPVGPRTTSSFGGAAPMAPVSDRPPRKVPPPSDPERAKVVSALAQRVASNPQFEFVVLAKNINNPLFDFLYEEKDVEGFKYYKWAVYCYKNRLDPETAPEPEAATAPPPAPAPAATPAINPNDPVSALSAALQAADEVKPTSTSDTDRSSRGPSAWDRGEIALTSAPPPRPRSWDEVRTGPPTAPPASDGRWGPAGNGGGGGGGGGGSLTTPLPPADKSELLVILDNLVGTKDSIKGAKDWIMARMQHADDIAETFADVAQKHTEFTPKLNLVYVINDVLYHASKSRSSPMILDPLSNAFFGTLGRILHAAHSGGDAAQQERVLKVLSIWGSKGIYTDGQVAEIEDQCKTGRLPAPPSGMASPGARRAADSFFQKLEAEGAGGRPRRRSRSRSPHREGSRRRDRSRSRERDHHRR